LTCNRCPCAEPLAQTPSPGLQENNQLGINVAKQAADEKEAVPTGARPPATVNNASRAANNSNREENSLQSSSPAAQQCEAVPQAKGLSRIASIFDCSSPDRHDTTSPERDLQKSASREKPPVYQEPEALSGGVCNAAKHTRCEGNPPASTAATTTEDSGEDNCAPDWLATQAATQIVAVPRVADSQPFPFDFAAHVREHPKRVLSPPMFAAPKETGGRGDDLKGAVPRPDRCSSFSPYLESGAFGRAKLAFEACCIRFMAVVLISRRFKTPCTATTVCSSLHLWHKRPGLLNPSQRDKVGHLLQHGIR
jgi:hypothetical protein